MEVEPLGVLLRHVLRHERVPSEKDGEAGPFGGLTIGDFYHGEQVP